MNTVYVSARIEVKPGSANAWWAATKPNMPLVRAEKGCIKYDLHQAQNSPDTFLFYEMWRDADALHAHAHSPHMNAYHEATKQLVERAEVETWHARDILP